MREVTGFSSGKNFSDLFPVNGHGLVNFQIGKEEWFIGDGFAIVISY